MLVSTRTYQILKGVRGQEGVDIEADRRGPPAALASW